ncbi:peptidoglycan DD-metalloendopeptidase family protein [Nostoc sp. CMAA1605]|uniref:peptidoglycan DD-metalloendopeptidase family protein n=1 Tax=Nostoc sp. CMAA1605 TaxID=2055159 RepID=UPI001F1D2114|nr:peptidoglycan DD-metalloendopeptidase family protein [Nostoc sp. CMAA1605]MCF4967268.1 peptidase M23 [Nostoc sp. CMAA1605]
MTQRNHSAHNPKKRLAYTLPAQGLCWLGGVSLLSGGLVLAQTETSIDNIVPTVETSQPTAAPVIPVKKDVVVPAASPSQPKFSARQTKLQQRLRQSEVSQSPKPVRQSQPSIENEANEPVFSVRKSQPQVEASQVTPTPNAKVKPQREVTTSEQKPTVAQPSLNNKKPVVTQPSNASDNNNSVTVRQPKQDYNNAYIDPNDYSANTTGTYQAPNSVILTERSSGCRTVVNSGQGVTGSACAQTPSSNQRTAKSAPTWIRNSQTAQLATASPVRTLATTPSQSRWRGSQVPVGSSNKTAFQPNRFIPNPSEFATTKVSATPIAPSAGTLPPPMAEGNIAPRESNVAYDIPLASVLPQIPYTSTLAYRGGNGMVYPLAAAAPVTSIFGWRIHPITGDRRFHAGTDLGAPSGTPILAAARGQVETADWVGGYGLTVILNHSSAQQTLYGHMSEILVQPGQWVEPGTVIGRVGSTGNSTGPHLHFEVRHLTQNGWVAVDPGVELQVALSQLLQGVQTAQALRRE